MPIEDRTILEFLGHVERREARLLSWGVVDAAFTRAEMRELAEAHYPHEDHLALVEALLERAMLLETRNLLRSRMAETVRLLARLRQSFPQHMQNGGWATAPTLVADYRLILRPRAFPNRLHEPDNVVENVRKHVEVNSLQESALRSLLRTSTGGVRRLASFQREAVSLVARALDHQRSSGVIVSAGTGSGKTLAFYLPALSHIANQVTSGHWTKALAIYPRNELLKDQLTETYREVRRLDSVMKDFGKRKITIGAYFGDIPKHVGAMARKWTRIPGGYQCPIIRCPMCDGDMGWFEIDQPKGIALRCLRRTCATTIGQDEILLTRDQMERTPPDLLFTTTEMLHRNLSNTVTRHVFGLGPLAFCSPDLVLLDEVHTYHGMPGAQVALLMRRWRHALGRPIRFVGLSATLREAPRFFSRLVGLDEEDVVHLAPASTDLVRQGMEYMLALRSDPASGASMLATSIQTAMLLRRMLDPQVEPRSGKAYGSKLFVFTDNLDVVNRLYFDLLDAEGLNSYGNPNPRRGGGSLSNLRGPTWPDRPARDAEGQSWWAPEAIGNLLLPRNYLNITRTSSQDTGVDQAADIVVATATLEVGFNDPDVGAVLQHKAPMDSAQFMQRKGRAGRHPDMRPWTVVVLSDYGRDRQAYHGYDMLFDPVIEPRNLPIGNRHVLRIQAVHSLMDWLSSQSGLNEPRSGSVWDDLTGPTAIIQNRNTSARERQQRILAILRTILDGQGTREDLTRWLSRSLAITAADVRAILWEPPRGILTAVIPTIIRRLETNWANVATNPPSRDLHAQWSPLPDFTPPNLFSDLNLPEVMIVTPPEVVGEEPRENPMPVRQAMAEFAPGRVSRRFGIRNRTVRHWVPLVSTDPGQQELDIASFVSLSERIGTVPVLVDSLTTMMPLVRPHHVHVSVPPTAVRDSTNGTLVWQTQLWPVDGGRTVEVPRGTGWDGFLSGFAFFTHNGHSGVEVRRFAHTGNASVVLEDGSRNETSFSFCANSSGSKEQVSLGFALRVDGMAVRFQFPDDLAIGTDHPNRRKIESFRTGYFHQLVSTSPELDEIANHFQRIWLAQAYLSAVAMRAVREGGSLADAAIALHGRLADSMREVLEAIFQTIPPDDAAHAPNIQRVHQMLLDLIAQPAVLGVLETCARVLWSMPDNGWNDLARERFRTTLGAAVLHACNALCPEFNAKELLVDVHAGPRPTVAPVAPQGEEIWLTEEDPGGGGIIETIARRVVDDPRRFMRLMEAALAPTDFTLVDVELRRILEATVEPGVLQDQLQTVRQASGNEETWRAFERLRELLKQQGFLTYHPILAALSTRVLRPGTSQQTDRLLLDLVTRWGAEERRLGVEIDSRVFSYCCAEDTALDMALSAVAVHANVNDRRQWRTSTVFSLLWPRGMSIRAQALHYHNPYAVSATPDPDLLIDVLGNADKRIIIDSPEWRSRLEQRLREHGQAELCASADKLEILHRTGLELTAVPIDIGGIMAFPRIVGLSSEENESVVLLEIREVL